MIFSKTRLAPQNITIPRLELMGVLIGIYALEFVKNELHLQVTSTIVFSDSIRDTLASVQEGTVSICNQ